MEKLSDHFTLQELTKSQLAVRQGIDNTPTKEAITNLVQLCNNVLEPIRMHFSKPVVVSSGYRSVELNILIGGSPTSDHCLGCAADIEIPGVSNLVLFNWVKNNLKFKQLILEFHNEAVPDSGWCHVGFLLGSNKQQSLRASKIDGRTIYTPA